MFLNLYTFVQSLDLRTRLVRQEGQTMAEYGVVLGVITLAAVGAFLLLGGEIKKVIEAVITRFDGTDG